MNPAIILVNPQLAENIGAAARAMWNCGLTDLRLVRPRDAWPNDKAVAAATGAADLVRAAPVFETVEEATADLQYVLATSARSRDMVKPVLTARGAGSDLRVRAAAGERCGVLFGPERAGLISDHIALADGQITIPLNPAYSSLNLAQAVLLVAYEWMMAADATPPRALETGDSPIAAKGALVNLFRHVEEALFWADFFTEPERAPHTLRNLRNCLQRARLTEQEVRTFHGILVAFVGTRRKGQG